MRKIITFFSTICFCAALLVLQGCAKEGIIGERDMARIISGMYLADQYIEKSPQLMAQSDSMMVYPAIVAKYGYTMDDYNRSIEYYLQEGEELQKIHKSAREILQRRADEIEVLLGGVITMKRWWAPDSIKVTTPQELMYDRYLRGVKWLTGVKCNNNWSVLDSAIVDIPQHSQWWQNNITPPKREYKSYMVKEAEKESIKGKNEKNSGKLRTPDKRVSNPKRIRSVQ